MTDEASRELSIDSGRLMSWVTASLWYLGFEFQVGMDTLDCFSDETREFLSPRYTFT